MGGYILLLTIIIFMITIGVILKKPPDRMSGRKTVKTGLHNLWAIIRMCQTANYGEPSLHIKPARRSVFFDIKFPDKDKIIASWPLKLEKQKKARGKYIDYIDAKGLTASTYKSGDEYEWISVTLDRQNDEAVDLITDIYTYAFEADAEDDTEDEARFTIQTLASDTNFISLMEHGAKYKRDLNTKAASARHGKKSPFHVISNRIVNAIYWLLFPSVIIISYKAAGLIGMQISALIFFAAHTIYTLIFNTKKPLRPLLWGGLYCGLLGYSLYTGDKLYLQIIPSAAGVTMGCWAIYETLQTIKSKNKPDKNQESQPLDVALFSYCIFMLTGWGLFAVNEWARQNMDLDSWVWFFAFFRIEMILAMMLIFTPAYLLISEIISRKTKPAPQG